MEGKSEKGSSMRTKKQQPFTVPKERRETMWTDTDIEKVVPLLVRSLRRFKMTKDEKLACDKLESWAFGKYLQAVRASSVED